MKAKDVERAAYLLQARAQWKAELVPDEDETKRYKEGDSFLGPLVLMDDDDTFDLSAVASNGEMHTLGPVSANTARLIAAFVVDVMDGELKRLDVKVED